jgi:hypothetical protein
MQFVRGGIENVVESTVSKTRLAVPKTRLVEAAGK